jgi:hypothetical protein
MYLRDAPTTTLGEVAEDWNTNLGAVWGGGLHKVSFDLTTNPESPVLRLDQHEVRATPETIGHVGGYLNIPTRYLLRLPGDMQEWLLNSTVDRAAEEDVTVHYSTDGGVSDITKNGAQRITPGQIAEMAANVMPEESLVTDHWANAQELRLDVIVPEGYGTGWVTGAAESKEYTWRGEPRVGDITGGGLRYTQNRKQNLSVEINKLTYRLACTNGMEIPAVTGGLDARGMNVDEMIAYLESEARRLFGQVEDDIRSFYDLRSQPLSADRTGDLRRIAQEAGLPARTVGRLEDLLPDHMADPDEQATMFDVANLMTNLANSPSIRGNATRTLQRVGGSLVNDHAARCQTCHHRL